MFEIYRLLINIKNGQTSKKAVVLHSLNQTNVSLLSLLWEEGFISGYSFSSKKNYLKIFLKYNNSHSLISSVRYISKPSLKRFISASMLWKLNDKLGVFILSTSKGLLTLKKCKKYNLGGILLFFIK